MGDGCGNEAESADEPGSRFGTLEITSWKRGKLQRPVKPEKQGADVSRKTGSHDGPERGWPREPRGSLEAVGQRWLPSGSRRFRSTASKELFPKEMEMAKVKTINLVTLTKEVDHVCLPDL